MIVSKKPLSCILAIALLAPFVALPRHARAGDDSKTCLDAYVQTQKLRKSGKLLKAHAQALVCAQASCAASMRDDCAQWAVDIDKSIPSVVFGVTDAEGHDVTDVTVYVDDEKLLDHLDGKAVPLEPGSHKVKFVRGSDPPMEETVLAKEGEKNRTITVRLPKADGGAVVDKGEKKDGPTAVIRPTPTATYVLLGLGAVGLVGFVGFGLSGNSKKSALDDRGCKPDCPQDDVDAVKKSYLLADISLGVAVVSFGVATVLYLARGEEPAPTSGKSGVRVAVAPHAGGGSAVLSFRF